MLTPPRILLIGYGNPGRCDDGLGPALAQRLESLDWPGLDVEADYQLEVEHAREIALHDVVVFADASTSGPEPFSFRPLDEAGGTISFTTHALEPAEALTLARDLFGSRATAFVLAIRGYEFDRFGEGLSPRATENLDQAVRFVERALRQNAFHRPVARHDPPANRTAGPAGAGSGHGHRSVQKGPP